MSERKQVNIRLTAETDEMLATLIRRLAVAWGVARVTVADVFHAGMVGLLEKYPEQPPKPKRRASRKKKDSASEQRDE